MHRSTRKACAKGLAVSSPGGAAANDGAWPGHPKQPARPRPSQLWGTRRRKEVPCVTFTCSLPATAAERPPPQRGPRILPQWGSLNGTARGGKGPLQVKRQPLARTLWPQPHPPPRQVTQGKPPPAGPLQPQHPHLPPLLLLQRLARAGAGARHPHRRQRLAAALPASGPTRQAPPLPGRCVPLT